MKEADNLNGRILFVRLGFCGGRSTVATIHMNISTNYPAVVGVLRMTNEGSGAAVEERKGAGPKMAETYDHVHEHLDRIKIKSYSNSISGPSRALAT